MPRKPKPPSEGNEGGRAEPNIAEPATALVSVTVPQDTSITIQDLKKLTPEDRAAFLNKVKTAKVGFVILNAPFKTRAPVAEPAVTGIHDP